MVCSLDLVAALLVVFVRRFFGRIPFIQSTVMSTATPEVSLYKPITFVAGGLIYYLARIRNREWVQIAKDFSRRALSGSFTLHHNPSELYRHRVTDRIGKAKSSFNEGFQGPQALQKKSKLFLQNFCSARKLPSVIAKHTVSRFVPGYTPKNKDAIVGAATQSSKPDALNGYFNKSSTVKITHDAVPSTSTGITHQHTNPVFLSQYAKNYEPFRKIQVRNTEINLRSSSDVLKQKYLLHQNILTNLKKQRQYSKRLNKGRSIKPINYKGNSSDSHMHGFQNKLNSVPTFTAPTNVEFWNIDDGLRDTALIRTTRSGRVYGYREISNKYQRRLKRR